MLFGSGKEAELNDKEVEIDVGDILDALTGIFTYNPEDEDPQGDPPGPWDGYSLFTIDLTAVKQSLEDIIAALQQHDPDYDPDETPPEDAVEDLIEENEQQEQTIEDLTEQVEECDQCKADVIAKLQEYDPDFDPVTCSDIPSEIDKVAEEAEGYEFEEDVPIDAILPIVANDVVNTVPPSYGVRVYLRAYASDRTTLVQEGKRVTATQATGMLYAGIYLDVIDATTGEKETMYNQYFALNPNRDSYYLEVKECILSGQFLTVNCEWGSSQTASYRFQNQNLQYLSNGPYKVTNN